MAVLHGKPLAAYLNTILPKLLPKCFRSWECIELIGIWQWALSKTLKRWLFFYDDGPETQSTAEVSEFPLSWYACHYPQMFDMEPDKWATLITAFLGQNCRGLQGRPIQSIEVALSAVIREFKHSTSLQDDTSLNSLSTHHPPTHLTWLYDMIFLQTINQLPLSLCMNTGTTCYIFICRCLLILYT